MNKKELAKLALRERRAGRNPNRVLAAAVNVGEEKRAMMMARPGINVGLERAENIIHGIYDLYWKKWDASKTAKERTDLLQSVRDEQARQYELGNPYAGELDDLIGEFTVNFQRTIGLSEDGQGRAGREYNSRYSR